MYIYFKLLLNMTIIYECMYVQFITKYKYSITIDSVTYISIKHTIIFLIYYVNTMKSGCQVDGTLSCKHTVHNRWFIIASSYLNISCFKYILLSSLPYISDCYYQNNNLYFYKFNLIKSYDIILLIKNLNKNFCIYL